MPALITNDLQAIIDARNPSRVDILMEAVPGEARQARRALNDIGVQFSESTVGQKTVFEATVETPLVDQLQQLDSLVRIDHSPTFQATSLPAPQPGDGGYSEASGIRSVTMQQVIRRMGVPAAREAGDTRGEGVKVGVVDTPVDNQHESFADNVEGSAGPAGAEDHGTWVTSAIAASEFETGRGVIEGVAPECEIYTYGALANGGATVTQIADGINYCVEQGCDVINLSLGGPHSEVLRSVVEEARAAGTLPVSSAGNSGPGGGTISCPAHHDATLSVGSEDLRGDVAAFSSRGPGFNDAPQKPEVMAFGGGARLGDPGLQITETVLGAAPNDGSKYLVGTSMASPQVAGLAALRIGAERGE